MFDINTKAELRNINLRAETHGDEYARAIDVQLMLLQVPVDRITSALSLERFYEGDQPVLQEVYPLCVKHKINNLAVTIGKVKLNGADAKGIEVTPQPGKVCNVKITVQSSGFGKGVLDQLSEHLREECDVTIVERQMQAPGMDQ